MSAFLQVAYIMSHLSKVSKGLGLNAHVIKTPLPFRRRLARSAPAARLRILAGTVPHHAA
jgi:hypothetical protein